MPETTYYSASSRYEPNGAVSVWPVWELQGHGTVTGPTAPTSWGDGGARRDQLPPWFNIRLTFADGARIDVLAVVSEGRIAIEDMRADPPLSLDGFAVLADWIEGPLEDACRVVAEQHRGGLSGPRGYFGDGPEFDEEPPGKRRARPSWPRGSAGRRIAAEAYRAAQEEGRDPVLAVMYATGRSRRKSLKVIASARDEGYLAPRHNRR
ncbi:hypothetical protein GCM10010329_61180 [Streptomyces spiroverticillatus]|uniref:Uncharacterized protein n=1 Tax=Streptomyces finlayi TaxID=67296 RepID=A0A919CD53_9ACTN|nr:DUF6214 family protein [Streptomyces finlayi]GHA29597.1 hypothetical protein GCM10010329_61180 [Streptomyces spiroverticillatus]GHD09975.1 hypothetical protein GCM10010334_64840 [Streptomyces finlayi]